MYTDTEGIVFKQVKTVNGRRMVLLFSQKFGKISAGTNISEKGKGKTSLAMKPFTYGRYEIYKNRDSFHINNAEVIKSFYSIGEDVEKYMYCSYALEFTEKILPEESPAPELLKLIVDFFEIMEQRKKKFQSLILAYQIKALKEIGLMPEIKKCTICGEQSDDVFFSIKNGGIVCKKCMTNIADNSNDTLIYKINFDIVNVLQYILKNPLKSFGNLALDDDLLKPLSSIIKSYISYHLDISELKSESFLADNL